jgi:hypothetical protein
VTITPFSLPIRSTASVLGDFSPPPASPRGFLGCKQKFNHAVNDNLGVEDFCRPSDSRRISQECEEGRDAAIRSHSAAVSPTALRKTMGPDRYLPFLPTILNWIQQTLE